MNFSTCGCLLAPQCGITLTTRVFRSQHYTLSNSYKLVRAPRPLCRCRPPHGSHMVQRLQALCLAHRLHTAPSVHRFRRAPPALSQVTLCQLRRGCHAALLCRILGALHLRKCSPTAPATHPHPTSGRRHADYSTHRCLSGRFYATLARGVLSQMCPPAQSLGGLGSTFSARRFLPHPVASFLFDAAVQTPLYSVASHDASTQLPLTEFFIGCIFSHEPLDRQASPSAHCNAGSASPPQPTDIATLCSPSSASHASDGHEDTTAPRVSPQPPPGFEKYASQCASHGLPVKAAPVRPRLCTSISVTPHSHISVPSKWKHILCARLLPTREVQVPPLREPTILLVQILVQELVLFPNHEPWFFLWSILGNPNLTGLVTLIQPSVISCIINTVSLFSSGIQGRRAGTPPILSRRLVENSMRLFFKKSVIMSRTSPISSLHTLATRTSPSCSTRTFEPDPTVLAFRENFTSKGTWGMVLLIVRALLRRPSLSGTPKVTFCSVHIHNVVAKKRDASTDLLRRLHGYMKQHNIDFIGGDFNMSAFSTVGDVFWDTEFSAPGNSFLWELGALEEPNRERTGFLIMPKRPYDWRVDTHGCYKYDKTALGFGHRDQTTHLPVFLHLRTTNLPGPNSIMRSEQAQQRRFERRHNKHERMRRRRT